MRIDGVVLRHLWKTSTSERLLLLLRYATILNGDNDVASGTVGSSPRISSPYNAPSSCPVWIHTFRPVHLVVSAVVSSSCCMQDVWQPSRQLARETFIGSDRRHTPLRPCYCSGPDCCCKLHAFPCQCLVHLIGYQVRSSSSPPHLSRRIVLIQKGWGGSMFYFTNSV